MFHASQFTEQAKAHGADLYTGVPCSFLKPLINYVIDADDVDYVPMNNEGEAVAYACGAYMAGRRPVVMFQNSGLGNTVNPVTSLAVPFQVPLLLIATWRGQPGVKDEPQHKIMGDVTAEMLRSMQVENEVLGENAAELGPALRRAAEHRRRTHLPYGFILPKGSVEPYALRSKPDAPRRPAGEARRPEAGDATATRMEAIQIIACLVGEDHVIIGTTGKTGRELYLHRDSPNHLYMVGAMGCAASFGLGMARHLPAHRKVIVIDGDGAALMRLEAMASVGYFQPRNLVHLLLDNNVHDSTGGQQTLSGRVAFDRVAAGCGYADAVSVCSAARFEREVADAMATDGPRLIHMRILPGSTPELPRPGIGPADVKKRLMAYLGTDSADE